MKGEGNCSDNLCTYLGDDEAQADEERDRLAHLHHSVPAAIPSQA